GEPMVKLPAGTTTISGHVGQSFKCSVLPAPGLKQRRSFCPTLTSIPSQREGVITVAGCASFAGTACAAGVPTPPSSLITSSNRACEQLAIGVPLEASTSDCTLAMLGFVAISWQNSAIRARVGKPTVCASALVSGGPTVGLLRPPKTGRCRR